MSFRDNPKEFAKWMEWLFAPQIPQGDTPSNQTKKGPAKLCCGDITLVGTASRRGTNEAEEREMNLDDVREIWQRHGGGHHGPRVETWDIPEAKMMAFVEELIRVAGIHRECEAAYTEALKTQRRQL